MSGIEHSPGAGLASRVAVGEVAEFVGVPNPYFAGDSVFMSTSGWLPADQLPEQARASLGATPALVALAGSVTQTIATANPGYDGLTPAATANDIAVKAAGTSAASRVLVFAAGTVRGVATGQPCTTDRGGCVTSDNAAFYSWAVLGGATHFTLAKSSDGLNWTQQVLNGLPAFDATAAYLTPWGSSASKCDQQGRRYNCAGNTAAYALYCGAQHLLIGPGATNSIAALSPNGTAFGSVDQSMAVLGTAALPRANQQAYWQRNGQTFFLYINSGGVTVARCTQNGGAAWSDATGFAVANPTNGAFQPNAADPLRIFYSETGSQTMRQTANGGMSWSVRTFPVQPQSHGVAYKASTVLVLNQGLLYRSADDGASFGVVVLPASLLAAPTHLFADANRFYVFAGSQVATSVDGVTWLVRNLPANAGGLTSLAALDANTVIAVSNSGQSNAFYSRDGGVTWSVAYPASVSATGLGCLPITQGGGHVLIGTGSGVSSPSYMVAAADLSAPGFYRATTNSVTPSRAGMTPMRRVL